MHKDSRNEVLNRNQMKPINHRDAEVKLSQWPFSYESLRIVQDCLDKAWLYGEKKTLETPGFDRSIPNAEKIANFVLMRK